MPSIFYDELNSSDEETRDEAYCQIISKLKGSSSLFKEEKKKKKKKNIQQNNNIQSINSLTRIKNITKTDKQAKNIQKIIIDCSARYIDEHKNKYSKRVCEFEFLIEDCLDIIEDSVNYDNSLLKNMKKLKKIVSIRLY